MPCLPFDRELEMHSRSSETNHRASFGVRCRNAWIERILPEAGPGRIAWIALAAVVVIFKCLAIFHFRADSDETQHAHVVWALAHGQLQYRDFFDNHMPLFQMVCAPLFRLLGEHSYILVELRFLMLPLYVACLWCVFTLAEELFSRRLAPWACLCAAALPPFFYTSTEFRPDLLWAAVWLLSLVVALCGPFTLRRAFALGFLLGMDLAVSIKTPVLWAALAVSTAIAFGVSAWLGKTKIRWKKIPIYLVVITAGAVIVPGAIIFFFASKGALGIMYNCVVRHNLMPGLKRWSNISLFRWIFPVSIPAMIGFGILTYKQAQDYGIAMRRVNLLLTPCAFAALMYSYCPDITRQDALPYAPLVPLLTVPFIVWMGPRIKAPNLEGRCFKWILPAVCLVELVCVWKVNALRTNRLEVTNDSIRDVLLITKPNEYVMDAEAGYVFRPRPDYWVFETVTRARIRSGLIHDHLRECLVKTETPMCYLYTWQSLPATARFIVGNYIPFDEAALKLGVAGKEMEASLPAGTFSFDVEIPATYALVSEAGTTAGWLDGAPYAGGVRLKVGHHVFRRTSGTGRAAIFLARALAAGFRPLFDASEKAIQQEEDRAALARHPTARSEPSAG